MKQEELSRILHNHKLWLSNHDKGKSANLSNANLRHADLSNANLIYANLSNADLRYANLSDANISGANLSDADLRYANLRYVNISGANLSDANISDAILRHANLSNANLSGANLSNADLRYVNLSDANLSDANLISNANLRYANLSNANLIYANISDADLRYANLSDAILRHANLSNADLRYANLSDADLRYANISGANLSDVKNIPEYVYTVTNILPEGDIIGYKKAKIKGTDMYVIVKMLISKDTKRSNATGRKCRCKSCTVLSIEFSHVLSDTDVIVSTYDENFVYKIGEVLTVNDFDENRWKECSTGIHFFITKQEAIDYQ
jgi:uncharacterized protein YjbI with pentapeptide repeats